MQSQINPILNRRPNLEARDNSTSGKLTVSGTDSENLHKTCLSVRSGSLNGHLRPKFLSKQLPTPMQHASGRSPRGGDRHGPNHTSSRALCMELSELKSSIPIGVMGRAAAIARARAAGKLFKSVFSSGIGWNSSLHYSSCAASDKPNGNTKQW